MKLEIILPVMLALLTGITTIAFKFNLAYQKYKVYLSVALYMIAIAALSYYFGISHIYDAIVSNPCDLKLTASIYEKTQIDLISFLFVWLPILLYVESIGYVYVKLKEYK